MANAASCVLLLVLGGLALFPATANVFCDNLKQVAAILPKNTASSPAHFATTVFGQAPGVVYALAFCRGDVVNDTTCGECVANTFDLFNSSLSSQQQCYKAAYYYGGSCSLVYSADNILTSSNTTDGNNGDDPPFTRWNLYSRGNWGNWSTTNITGDADDVALTVGLLNELLVKTVQTAASTTPGRFATGVMDSPTTIVFYSMAQCTPDLSDSKCLACLTRLLGTLNFTMTLRMGGQLHVIRCFFRYEAYPFYDSKPMLHLGRPPVTAPTPVTAPVPVKHKRRMNNLWIILIAVFPPAVAAFLCFIFCCPCLRSYRKGSRRTRDLKAQEELVWQGKSSSEFSVFEFEQLLEATNNFSEENKLGQGGFGAVYKGKFPQGLEIAVKRLSSHSGQGFIEFKNEVQLIAKLQHRNLVRLLGCCSQEEEKILVYEYLPNKSLDFFIFDENRRALLDWNKRIAITEGIAHGLLYLHKHSRLRVIHRDLKPSNILLDGEMNPKISDFGLAKIFTSNNTEESTTRRVVGTYGYMAPEYAYEGLFSIKSDVFSFGVLVLEILGGKRNSASGHECGNFINLLGYAWKLFEEERWSELIDASLDTISHSEEMMRCMNIALLCVQEKAADRPTISDVVAMLGNKSIILVKPKHPAYFNLSSVGNEEASTAMRPSSINDVTISVTTTGR